MAVNQIGRFDQVYVKKEASFGTPPTFAGSDAVRVSACKLNYNPTNMKVAEDRYLHPSPIDELQGRITADWMLGGIFYPSGTIGTAPDHSEILECGMGAVAAPTPLSTTIASGPTTTGAVVASATGLAVGQAILINVTTGSPATGRVVRWLTVVAGTTLTWAPALPQAPAVGDTVKSTVTWSLATALPASLHIGRYKTSIAKAGQGALVNQLKLMLDANDVVRWEASGPMQTRITAQTIPGTFVTAGTNPPTGIVGGMRIGSSARAFLKMAITINNAMELQNEDFGTSSAYGYDRIGQRLINVELDTMFTDDTTLITAAEGASDNVLLAQCGNVEGKIIGIYAPKVRFDVPDDPDGDGKLQLAFKGLAKGTNGNDDLYVCAA